MLCAMLLKLNTTVIDKKGTGVCKCMRPSLFYLVKKLTWFKRYYRGTKEAVFRLFYCVRAAAIIVFCFLAQA